MSKSTRSNSISQVDDGALENIINRVVERANTALQGYPQTQSIAKITIESINLKVPHLTPNDDIKLQLLTRIKADESMMIPFRRWELHELPALTQGSTIEIWSVKTCSALDSPRYVIVFFQTKKADNLHEDVTLFDNANIKSIRLALNSDYYPQERMLLDFSRDQYADAHFNYTEFNKSYHNCQGKRSLVNFAEFKSRPMFVINCSRRHLGLKSSTVDINVKVVERANTALQGYPQTQSIAKITIESINLKVPHLTPNDDIKLQLLTRIKADESMMIPFRRWELHELPALTQGSTIEIWSVKTCSALDSPRYVIVFFQTKKADNLHEDVTLFDNANIKSIRLALNSDYYPQERMLLDFSRDQYADAHFNYTEFNKSYHNCQGKRSLVNFAEFKSRPMFVINCSRRHLGLKSSTVDIKIGKKEGVSSNGKPRCVIVDLVTYLKRAEILNSKKLPKGTGIFLNEDLTKNRYKLLSLARQKHGIHNAWSRDGRIFVKDGDVKIINVIDDV
ncbi:unnamed protein product [Phaedon cochleariae]|uniref:Double jelly roll-like domain-containing protein n=1 Tax=Phaedon cochleariae TaxID=80249 RepID=A0A9N9SGT9_PHACE|nr:unnamed protein product [Phaedon cochleariae]